MLRVLAERRGFDALLNLLNQLGQWTTEVVVSAKYVFHAVVDAWTIGSHGSPSTRQVVAWTIDSHGSTSTRQVVAGIVTNLSSLTPCSKEDTIVLINSTSVTLSPPAPSLHADALVKFLSPAAAISSKYLMTTLWYLFVVVFIIVLLDPQIVTGSHLLNSKAGHRGPVKKRKT